MNNIIINDELYINESISKSLNGETSLYNKSLSNSKSDIIEKIRSSLLNNYNEINKIINQTNSNKQSLIFVYENRRQTHRLVLHASKIRLEL